MDLYATQGGGKVYWDDQQEAYVFYNAPNGFKVGDFMPVTWGIGGVVGTIPRPSLTTE